MAEMETIEKNGLYHLMRTRDASMAWMDLQDHDDYVRLIQIIKQKKKGHMKFSPALKELMDLYSSKIYASIRVTYRGMEVADLSRKNFQFIERI